MSIQACLLSHARHGKKLATIALAGVFLAVPVAWAAPISTDLSISGSVAFDAANSFADSGSSSSGDLKAKIGGTDSSSAYNGSTGGSLAGNLTETGDGFGFTGSAASSSANGDDTTFKTFIDIALSLSNTSATDTYKIFFNVLFNNAVDSNGTDAYADSEFFVRNPSAGPDLFFTDITSDTLNGDAVAGGLTGTFGDALTDLGPDSFFITLAPGASVSFGPGSNPILWSLAGGAFEAGSSSSASLDAFLSIASVENVTQPPNPIPEPATLALLGFGLAGLGMMRRRASHSLDYPQITSTQLYPG